MIQYPPLTPQSTGGTVYLMETTTAQYRYLGTTDDSTECEKCGKIELKSTVVLQPLDEEGTPEGDPVYYGSTCAARALAVKGGGREVTLRARGGHHDTLNAATDARRMLAHYGLPEAGDVDQDTLREAMVRYVRQHPRIHELVQETGVGVRAMVLDMLGRKRAALAAAALVSPVCSYCRYAH